MLPAASGLRLLAQQVKDPLLALGLQDNEELRLKTGIRRSETNEVEQQTELMIIAHEVTATQRLLV